MTAPGRMPAILRRFAETGRYALRNRGHRCGQARCWTHSHHRWCECVCLLCRVARFGRPRAERPAPGWARDDRDGR